jgi:hypothetical protein
LDRMVESLRQQGVVYSAPRGDQLIYLQQAFEQKKNRAP